MNQTTQRAELLHLIEDLNATRFDVVADRVFEYQRLYNPLYAQFLELLGEKNLRPFLPISLFKQYQIQTGVWQPADFFESSGTTGSNTSRHLVREIEWYLHHARNGFSKFYGDPSEWCILALLPNYLERGRSSLVAMADSFIRLSKYKESGFFLNDFEKLHDTLLYCQKSGFKTLLLGVSFALLDFAYAYPMDLKGVAVMETGGMKGRRKEMTRQELHAEITEELHPDSIHSEYGMTELFSQAYAKGGVIFTPAPTMKVIATEINDPFCEVPFGRTGVLNILDLANLDTISFIQTEDLGKVYDDGRFEVLGRLDAAELRGCNLLVE
ncbi:MAG: acyl transferase [Saprospiraceae bacterium]|nr:acyl transferase [Saprospiraceae bacterium]